MKSIIVINAQSFFQSGYKQLAWAIQQETDNGTMTSLQENSVTEEADMHEALKQHVYNLSNAIGENNDLIDFEITLSFPDSMDDLQKETFTNIFNEFNTRDEST